MTWPEQKEECLMGTTCVSMLVRYENIGWMTGGEITTD